MFGHLKRHWYIVVEPRGRGTRDIEILFKFIVKVPVVGSTADTPNPPGLLPLSDSLPTQITDSNWKTNSKFQVLGGQAIVKMNY